MLTNVVIPLMFEQDLCCQEALGMESIAITDRQINASSEWGAASQGRLNSQTGGGAWIAAQDDANQWLQVDLGIQHTKVTRVATQVKLGGKLWVTRYKLQYSNDTVNMQDYTKQGQDNVYVKVTFAVSYKLLFLGYRSLIKSITQTAVINMVNQRVFIINLTFRTLSSIHLQTVSFAGR